jgi:predicted DCC family thiol-disulfide oxidoreductase YuxK
MSLRTLVRRPSERSYASAEPGHEKMNLIVYDGVCVLCSRSIRFVAAHDPAGEFRFVPLQSRFGHHLANEHSISVEQPETFVAIVDGVASFRSEAALAIAAKLKGLRWTRVLRIVPRALRDAIYDLVARNRYRWFGRYDRCELPSAALRSRVIEEVPASAAHP